MMTNFEWLLTELVKEMNEHETEKLWEDLENV